MTESRFDAEARLSAALDRWARGSLLEDAGESAALARIRAHGAALAATPAVSPQPLARWRRAGLAAAAVAALGLVALLWPAPAPLPSGAGVDDPAASFVLLHVPTDEEEMLL
jgi:hypothetical protein